MARAVEATRRGLRSLYGSWYRRLRMDLWFPHVPLALAVGGAGALALLPTIRSYAAEYLHLDLGQLINALHPISGEIPRLILVGVPATVVGVLQVLVALGLLARSRVAWLCALGLTIAQLVLAMHSAAQGGSGGLVSGQAIYVVVLFVALVAARRWFNWSSLAANTLFAVAAILVLMIYGVLGAFLLGAGFAPAITNLPAAFYFTIVTMSTVGYGDIVPKSNEARLFVVSLIVLGLTVFATALTAVVGPAVQGRLDRAMGNRRKQMVRANHFIITGGGVLAHNTARELRRRGAPVLVIVEGKDTSFGDTEVMEGDPTEIEALRAAGAEHARAVLALSDDDSENAFVILAAHELESEAKKVAAVSSRKNLERVRRVHPDMIMAAPVFAGEVLAMALTEEKIDGEWLLSRVLDVKPAGG
ncbi:MAG TPA: voltage-gated potassium channel protein [Acetobacteraceae bacterium]|jgi:voltage-gated potassium channel|nr:voltage-gated potassium channel protein [Acetobacteraceae bacterium]